jgi:hypothetical protein
MISNLRNVIKLSGLEKINKISLFVSESWKYIFYSEVIAELEITKNVGQIISKFISKYPDNKQEVSKAIPKLLKQPMSKENLKTQEEDYNFLISIKDFLELTFNTSIEIIKAEESDNEKAKSATPGKIGFLVE